MASEAKDAAPQNEEDAVGLEDRVSRELGVDRAQWLAGLLEHSTDVISILDLEGRILYINQTKPSTTPGKIVGRRASEFLPAPSGELWDQAFRRALQTRSTQHVELPSHGDYWWDTRLVPIRQGADVAYVVCIGTDITEKKRAESELASKEELLHLALAAARMGQWAWDITADRMIWDDTTSQMLDWSGPNDGTPLDSFLGRVQPEDQDKVRLHLEQAAQLGQLHPIEFRVSTQGGAERWLHLTGRANWGQQGKPRDLLGGVLDVTHQRQSEAAINRAQKLEALSQLAAGVAHDFNNLLVAIMGRVELAQIAKTPSEQQGLLNEAVSACLKAAELTRRLLAFGRHQDGVEQAVDVGELIRGTLKLLERLIPSSIVVELKLDPQVPALLGDRGQLEQVVMNLLLNARDAMPEGGKLSVSAMLVPLGSEPPQSGSRSRPPPSSVPPSSGPPSKYGHYVVLTFKDTGAGIQPEMLQRIFEPFFTTKAQGTGLGLPTVHSIVQQHGGCIDVQSELGKGAIFSVYLPTA